MAGALRLQTRPNAETEHLTSQFTPTVDGLEPGSGVRLVLVLLALLPCRNGAQRSFNNQCFQAISRLRLDGREVLLGDLKTVRERAEPHACLFAARIGQQQFKLVVRHSADDIFLDAERWPAEEQLTEFATKLFATVGMLAALVIGKAAKSQSAISKRFEQAECGLMATAIANMNTMLLQWRTDRTLQESAGKAKLCGAFGDNSKARQEGFGIGLAVFGGLRDIKRTDLSRVIDIPEADLRCG
jgi:hypothetical protein